MRLRATPLSRISSILVVLALGGSAQAQFRPEGRRKKPPATATTSPPKPRAPPTPSGAPKPTEPGAPAKPAEPEEGPDSRIEKYFTLAFGELDEESPLDRLIELYRARDGQLDALVARLEAARVAGPRGYEALVLLGRLAERLHDPKAALERYAAALSLAPERNEALLARARLELATRNFPEARASFELARTRVRGAELDEVLRTLRTLALDADDLTAARALHDELSRRARDNVFVRRELGRELLARGRFADAVVTLEELVASVHGDARAEGPALRDLAEAEWRSGALDRAEATVARAAAKLAHEPGRRNEVDRLWIDIARARGTLGALEARWRSGKPDVARLRLLAKLEEESGAFDRATRSYESLLERAPADLDARLSLVRLYELAGAVGRATDEYEKIVRQAVDDVGLSIRFMEALRAQGETKRAAAEFDRIEKRLHDAESTIDLLDYAERIEDRARAERLMVELDRKGSTDARHFAELGSRHHRAGRVEEARATWARILRAEPRSARAHRIHGEVLLDHDERAAGLRSLEKAVELAPDDLDVRRSLALGYERALTLESGAETRAYREGAERAWLAVLESARTSTLSEDALTEKKSEARRHLVRLWQRGDRLYRELTRLSARFSATPPDVEAGRLLGLVERKLGRKTSARDTVRRVVSLAPGDAGSWSELASIEEELGAFESALRAREKLVELVPARAPVELETMARLAARFHDDTRAASFARRAVQLAPDDARTHARLGELELALGHAGAAEKSYEEALRLDPKRFEVTLVLSGLALDRGDRARAFSRLLALVEHDAPDEALSRAVTRALGFAEMPQLIALDRALARRSVEHPERALLRSLLLEVYDRELDRLGSQPESEELAAFLEARAEGPLLALLANGRESEQRSAVRLLGLGHSREASRALLSFAGGNAALDLRIAALEALGPLDDSLVELVRAMADPKSARGGEIPRRAAWLLAKSSRPSALRALRTLGDHPDPDVRVMVLFGLADGGVVVEPAEARRFEGELADPTADPRLRAANALVLSRSLASARVLEAEFDSPEPLVASASLLALVAIARHEQKPDVVDAWLVRGLADARPLVRRTTSALLSRDLASPRKWTPDSAAADTTARFEIELGRHADEARTLDAAERLEAKWVERMRDQLAGSGANARETLARFQLRGETLELAPFETFGRAGVAAAPERERAAALAERVRLRLEPELLAWATATETEPRLRALELLGLERTAEPDRVRAVFREALLGADERAREVVLDHLAKYGSPRGNLLLEETFEQSGAWTVRRRVVEIALGERARHVKAGKPADPALERILARATDDPSPLVTRLVTGAR